MADTKIRKLEKIDILNDAYFKVSFRSIEVRGIVIKMKEKGLSVEMIAEISELSIKEVEKILNN